MVMFTNMHDQLLVNVPILLRLVTQNTLNLYSIDTVPMPFDTDTLDGQNNEFTFINNSYPYMALNKHNYIPLTETQLRMCDKMGSTYYCQNSYVSLRLRVQNAVPAQPCVGKLGISLVLLNFLHCNFRLWFKTS